MNANIRWCVERPNHVEKLGQFNTFLVSTWLYAGQYYPAKKGTYWVVELRNGQMTGVPTEQQARDLLWFLCNAME